MSRPDAFDVLGIQPGATAAEITAAYRQMARRHHPDQHPDATAQERRRHEAQMAEINTAHASLIGGWTRPPSTASRPPAASNRPKASSGSPPTPRPAAEPVPPPDGDPVSPWRVLAVLGAGTAVVLGLIAIVVAVIAPDSTTAPSDEQPVVVDPETWAVGTCVTDGPRAEAVRCEFPNRGMVVADVFTVDRCPAGTDAVVADPPRLLCIDFDA